jgi:hypothetical protein
MASVAEWLSRPSMCSRCGSCAPHAMTSVQRLAAHRNRPLEELAQLTICEKHRRAANQPAASTYVELDAASLAPSARHARRPPPGSSPIPKRHRRAEEYGTQQRLVHRSSNNWDTRTPLHRRDKPQVGRADDLGHRQHQRVQISTNIWTDLPTSPPSCAPGRRWVSVGAGPGNSPTADGGV